MVLPSNTIFGKNARGVSVPIPTVSDSGPLKTSVVLDNAAILTLPSTPVEVIPAPGVGKYLVPIFATIETFFPVSYENITDQTTAQGASDVVITWGNNAINVFRAVPLNFINGQFGSGRTNVAFCPPFMSLSDPVVVEDQLWAQTMGYPYNGADRVENNHWTISADNSGDFTDGDVLNTLRVTCWYYIRTFGIDS